MRFAAVLKADDRSAGDIGGIWRCRHRGMLLRERKCKLKERKLGEEASREVAEGEESQQICRHEELSSYRCGCLQRLGFDKEGDVEFLIFAGRVFFCKNREFRKEEKLGLRRGSCLL